MVIDSTQHYYIIYFVVNIYTEKAKLFFLTDRIALLALKKITQSR